MSLISASCPWAPWEVSGNGSRGFCPLGTSGNIAGTHSSSGLSVASVCLRGRHPGLVHWSLSRLRAVGISSWAESWLLLNTDWIIVDFEFYLFYRLPRNLLRINNQSIINNQSVNHYLTNQLANPEKNRRGSAGWGMMGGDEPGEWTEGC